MTTSSLRAFHLFGRTKPCADTFAYRPRFEVSLSFVAPTTYLRCAIYLFTALVFEARKKIIRAATDVCAKGGRVGLDDVSSPPALPSASAVHHGYAGQTRRVCDVGRDHIGQSPAGLNAVVLVATFLQTPFRLNIRVASSEESVKHHRLLSCCEHSTRSQ